MTYQHRPAVRTAGTAAQADQIRRLEAALESARAELLASSRRVATLTRALRYQRAQHDDALRPPYYLTLTEEQRSERLGDPVIGPARLAAATAEAETWRDPKRRTRVRNATKDVVG